MTQGAEIWQKGGGSKDQLVCALHLNRGGFKIEVVDFLGSLKEIWE